LSSLKKTRIIYNHIVPLPTERWHLDIICIKLNNQPTYSPQKNLNPFITSAPPVPPGRPTFPPVPPGRLNIPTRPTGTPQHTSPVPPGRPNIPHPSHRDAPTYPTRPTGTPQRNAQPTTASQRDAIFVAPTRGVKGNNPYQRDGIFVSSPTPPCQQSVCL